MKISIVFFFKTNIWHWFMIIGLSIKYSITRAWITWDDWIFNERMWVIIMCGKINNLVRVNGFFSYLFVKSTIRLQGRVQLSREFTEWDFMSVVTYYIKSVGSYWHENRWERKEKYCSDVRRNYNGNLS